MVSKSAQKNNSAQKSMDSAQKLLDSAQKLIDSAAVLKPRNSAQNSAGTIGTGLSVSHATQAMHTREVGAQNPCTTSWLPTL